MREVGANELGCEARVRARVSVTKDREGVLLVNHVSGLHLLSIFTKGTYDEVEIVFALAMILVVEKAVVGNEIEV